MKNIKYTLVASPEDQENPDKSRIRLHIYGEETNIDWGEGPRRERLTNAMIEELVSSMNRTTTEIPEDKLLFAGLNKEYPKIHKKIMEYNLRVSTDPKKGVRIKRGDFQRFDFGKFWNSSIAVLQTFVDEQFNTFSGGLRIFEKYGDEVYSKIDDYVIECVKNGTDSRFPKKANGTYDVEKIADMYAAEHGISPIEKK